MRVNRTDGWEVMIAKPDQRNRLMQKLKAETSF